MPVRPPGPATQIVPGIQFKFPEIQLQFASKKSPKVLGLPSEHGPPTLQDGATGRQLQLRQITHLIQMECYMDHLVYKRVLSYYRTYLLCHHHQNLADQD